MVVSVSFVYILSLIWFSVITKVTRVGEGVWRARWRAFVEVVERQRC